MDTNSSTVIQKKLIKVDVSHLNKTGYGPGGNFTRKAWRDECLKHFKAGKDDFLAWQNSWFEGEVNKDDVVSFESKIYFDDGSSVIPYVEPNHRCSLDFVGLSFYDCHAVGFTFLQNTIFASSNFFGVSNFGEANFNKFVSFERVQFEEMAWFNRTIFTQDVIFTNTIFVGDAWFTSVIFKEFVSFLNVRFNGYCNFSDFSGLKKNGLHTSQGVLFEGFANFENSIFEKVGHFELAKFDKIIPNFLGVDNAKTLLVFSGDEYFNKNDISEAAVNSLAQLKRLADEHGQIDQALMFNAFELNAKAKQPKAGWGMKIFTWLYDYTSNFGRSFLRPLGIYAVILFLTFLIALEHSAYNSPRNYTQTGCEKYVWWIERVTWIEDKNCLDKSNALQLTGIRAASEYTLYRAAGVLDFSDSDKQTKEVALRLFGQEIEPWWMRIWGIFKAITSTALLFLAALGLRNKYRIK